MGDIIQKAERLDKTKVEGGGGDPEAQACSFSVLPDWSDPIAIMFYLTTGLSNGARRPWIKTAIPNQFFLP